MSITGSVSKGGQRALACRLRLVQSTSSKKELVVTVFVVFLKEKVARELLFEVLTEHTRSLGPLFQVPPEPLNVLGMYTGV